MAGRTGQFAKGKKSLDHVLMLVLSKMIFQKVRFFSLTYHDPEPLIKNKIDYCTEMKKAYIGRAKIHMIGVPIFSNSHKDM